MESAKDVGKNIETNKYQEAKEWLEDKVENWCCSREDVEQIETLRELIDKVPYYEELEDKATPKKPQDKEIDWSKDE